jgi:hypothetical protein
MEKKFEQLDHFDKVVTYARQGYAGMTLSVKGGTAHADQREAWYQARKKFSDLKLELPDGVVGPIFNDEYGDVTGLLYAVKGDGISQWELSDVAEDVKRRLLKVPMVKKVDIYGSRRRKSMSNSRTSGWRRSGSRRCKSPRAFATRTRSRQAAPSTRPPTACSSASPASSTAWTTSAACPSRQAGA